MFIGDTMGTLHATQRSFHCNTPKLAQRHSEDSPDKHHQLLAEDQRAYSLHGDREGCIALLDNSGQPQGL